MFQKTLKDLALLLEISNFKRKSPKPKFQTKTQLVLEFMYRESDRNTHTL